MDKADDKVIFEGNKPEKFTNFEWLRKEVEVLRENVDELVEILNYNNLHRKKTIEANKTDEDEIFMRLEEENKK